MYLPLLRGDFVLICAAFQVGILVGLISASVQSLGLTLQRKSHILEDEKDPNDLRRPPFKRRRWQVRTDHLYTKGGSS